eukprot:763858-Hanusia_phi.AAC.3
MSCHRSALCFGPLRNFRSLPPRLEVSSLPSCSFVTEFEYRVAGLRGPGPAPLGTVRGGAGPGHSAPSVILARPEKAGEARKSRPAATSTRRPRGPDWQPWVAAAGSNQAREADPRPRAPIRSGIRGRDAARSPSRRIPGAVDSRADGRAEPGPDSNPVSTRTVGPATVRYAAARPESHRLSGPGGRPGRLGVPESTEPGARRALSPLRASDSPSRLTRPFRAGRAPRPGPRLGLAAHRRPHGYGTVPGTGPGRAPGRAQPRRPGRLGGLRARPNYPVTGAAILAITDATTRRDRAAGGRESPGPAWLPGRGRGPSDPGSGPGPRA